MLLLQGLEQRAILLQAIRLFFIKRRYLEVDTPIRLPVVIPEAHIEPFLSEDRYLQTSPEMCMKMLLARGCNQIFQICHCFRKEEIGRRHQSEFTMLEWYHCGWNYTDLMQECEELFRHLVMHTKEVSGTGQDGELFFQDQAISLTPPWQRISVADAFSCYAHVTVEEAMQTDTFDQVMVEDIEPNLGWKTPSFLYDYPVELASLSRPKKNCPELAERFELYIGGLELANGFSELVDPVVQQKRFEEEQKIILSKGRNTPMPEQFLSSLDQIDSAAGIALGVDRLLMLFMGCESIQEVLAFPEGSLYNTLTR